METKLLNWVQIDLSYRVPSKWKSHLSIIGFCHLHIVFSLSILYKDAQRHWHYFVILLCSRRWFRGGIEFLKVVKSHCFKNATSLGDGIVIRIIVLKALTMQIVKRCSDLSSAPVTSMILTRQQTNSMVSLFLTLSHLLVLHCSVWIQHWHSSWP